MNTTATHTHEQRQTHTYNASKDIRNPERLTKAEMWQKNK